MLKSKIFIKIATNIYFSEMRIKKLRERERERERKREREWEIWERREHII